MIAAVLGLLPSWWSRAVVVGALLAAVWIHGWFTGARHVQGSWDAAVVAQGVIQNRIAIRQVQVTQHAEVQYRDRVKVITQKGEDIIHAIPKYIPVDSCTAPPAERVLLDAAATGGPIPGPTAIADAAPVAAADVAATVAANYERCRVNAEQLTGLQEWIRAEQAASK